MSKIVTIGEHQFGIPEPKIKEDIFFLDDKDPCWNRERALAEYEGHNGIWYDYVPGKGGTKMYGDKTWYDSDGNLIELNKEDSDFIMRLYEKEWRRRTNGVHFKNGKEIAWLTGDHWFVLAWCKTKRPDKISEYFDYREFQAWFYYLIWYVNNTSWIDGLDLSKAKKTGITNLVWLYFLNKATMTKNLNLGNMNIDQAKGAKTFRDHFMYAFNGLPLPLKPGIKTKSETDGIITFGERAINTKRNSKGRSAKTEELNTTVMCVPTMANAFDVDVFADTWYDEGPKFTKDFGEIYRSNSEGTKLQDIAVGKKWLTSYNPEGEAPSFQSAKKIYFDSELMTINPELKNNRTRTGMICHHIPAYQSWTSSFDKYGKCDEVASMKKITTIRESLKHSPRELQTETRRYANNKREAWTTGGAGSVFDNARLAELLLDVEEEQRHSPDMPYQEGKFEWVNKSWEVLRNRPKGQFCNVEFIPLSKEQKRRGDTGRLRIYNDIAFPLKNAILKNGRDEWNCIKPPDQFHTFIGADPTQHAAASEVIEGSKNAYYCMSAVSPIFDALMKKVASGIILFEYFDRPESPDEAYEDLVKMIIYSGALCGIEANVPTMATNLMTEGLGHFMLIKDKYGAYRIWERYMGLPHEEEKEYHLLRTTSNSPESRERLEIFVRLLKRFIAVPADGEKNYGVTIKSERLLNQLLNLDVMNTKIFDLFMGIGYCMFTKDIYSAILLSKQEQFKNEIPVTWLLKALTRA